MSANSSLGLPAAPATPEPFWHKLRSVDRSRELVLIICFVLLLLMFSVTALVSRLYHKKIHTLADQWFAQGEAAFHAGSARSAITDYQNALVYSPNNSVFQLHLALALSAAGRLEEAGAYLINLLAESPGSGQINLELARVSAREGVRLDAVRYYQSAIYGVWDADPSCSAGTCARNSAQFLLDRGDIADAQPEILALAQEVPSGDLERQKQAGGLLLRAGLWPRALQEFQSILKQSRHDQDALVGAAIASYQLSNTPRRSITSTGCVARSLLPANVEGMLQASRQVEDSDPFRQGLSAGERAKRAAAAVASATSRVDRLRQGARRNPAATPPETDMQKLYATQQNMARDWSERTSRATRTASTRPCRSLPNGGRCRATMRRPTAGTADRILRMLGRSREGATP